MAYVEMTRYGAFEIVPDSGDRKDGAATTYVQTDWDYPGVATSMGWQACDCGSTDGTIDCAHRTASEMISGAFDWIEAHEGQPFKALDDYLPDGE